MLESNNIEVIAFHHVCTNSSLITKVEPEIFKRPEINILFKIIKDFYKKYSIVPNFRTIDQLREVISEDKQVHNFSPTKDAESNVRDFLGTAEVIISHPIDKYSPQWMLTISNAYLQWRQFETGMQHVINHITKTEVTPQNVGGLVSQMQSLFLTKTSISLHEESAIDFWNPQSHVQVQPENLINTGWPTFNTFLNGGFERKTLSHIWGAPNVGKSLFLGTIGRNVSMAGSNVYIGSLEMDSRKYVKRMGSSILNIPVREYTQHKDSIFFQQKLDLFLTDEFRGTKVHGHLHIQRFSHASPMTITLAADKLAKQLGIKWDLVIYDYLGELESSEYNLSDMYALHKTNNAAIFDHAVTYDWAALTAHQVTPDFFDAEDMSMRAAAESRGVNHRTDNIFGIIQNPMMYSAGKFFLKNLKARDNEYKNWYMRLAIDWNTMNLMDDNHMVKPNEQLMI